MGIAPYKYFTFDGESSRDYDVYLTGEGVFDAPERAVEMIEIAGRNGNFALDQGKFKNISITYKAGIVDASESNFADKVSAVRNWLCSKVGYKRLEDDYNPNEYRMGVFMAGVDVDHEDLKTGEFEITFDCKPQRWLTSGETATAVANNGTLTNPTLFDACPLLEVYGYGNITIGNNDPITIYNDPIGDITIDGQTSNQNPFVVSLEEVRAEQGDSIELADGYIGSTYKMNHYLTYYYQSATVTSTSGPVDHVNAGVTHSSEGSGKYVNFVYVHFYFTDPRTFLYGTASTNNTISATVKIHGSNGNDYTYTFKATIANKSNRTIVFSAEPSYSSFEFRSFGASFDEIVVHSTSVSYGQPTYIDLDVGEAYSIDGGVISSLNKYIALGSDMPTLPPDSTTFTYDNTITSFKVTPRWWKV